MAYFVLSFNGEESLYKFLSPDPDHLGVGPSHGYNTSCKTINSIDEVVFGVTRPERQTDPNTLPSQSSPGAKVIIKIVSISLC